jgi:Clp amino terminal domain, pathogenicity island component
MPPGPIERWRQRRHARHAAPAPPVPPAPPGLYQFTGSRPAGHITLTPGGQRTLERTIREAQIRHDPQLGAEHLALAIIYAGSGLVPAILSALGAPASALRAAILDHYWQAS